MQEQGTGTLQKLEEVRNLIEVTNNKVKKMNAEKQMNVVKKLIEIEEGEGEEIVVAEEGQGEERNTQLGILMEMSKLTKPHHSKPRHLQRLNNNFSYTCNTR